MILVGSVAAWPLARVVTPTAAWADPAVNVCTGLGVTLPTAQPVAGTADQSLTGLLAPVSTDLNALSSNVNVSLQSALNGQTLGVGVVNPATGTLVTSPSTCDISANTYTVTNNKGISLGGGVVSGLGGTANPVATAGDLSAIALGNGASTGTNVVNAIAIGPAASSTATGGVALGANASVTAGNSVALGANALAATGALTGYTAFGLGTPQDAVGEVSVGSAGAERRITNLAAGTTNTDAVNVAQLRGTASTLGTNIVNLFGGNSNYNSANNTITGPSYVINGNTYNTVSNAFTAINNYVTNQPTQYSTAGSPTTANPGVISNDVTLVGNGGGGGVFLHNVGRGTIGPTATDAVNGSQIYAGGQSIVTILGGNATYNPVNNTINSPSYVIRGNTYNTVGSALTALDQSLTTGAIPYLSADDHAGTTVAVSSGIGSTTLGYGASATATASSVFGNGASDNGVANSTVLGSGASITAGLTGSNVALGQGSVASTGGLAAYNAFGLVGTQTSFGEVSVGSATAQRQITNVAAGAANTDAVNVAQLRGTASTLATSITNVFGGNTTYNTATNTITSPTYVIRGNTYNSVSTALTALDQSLTNSVPYLSADDHAGTTVAVSSGAGSTTLGYGASATAAASSVFGNGASDNGVANSTVLGNGASITAGLAGSNVALGQGSVASTGSLTGYSAFGLSSPQNSGGEVSVGSAGTLRQITNLAAGLANTDAVNVAQLRGTASTLGTSITNVIGGSSTYDTTTGAITNPSFVINGTTYTTVSSALAALSNTPNTGGSPYFAANSRGTVASATGADSVAAGPATVASGTNAVAIGNGATSTGSNSVALGAGSTDGGTDSVVSVGAVGAERKVTNVAAGDVSATSTDAVNGAELYAVSALITGGGSHNTTSTDTTTTTTNGSPIGSGSTPVTIHNLAPGVIDTDAVTLGQLKDATANAVQYDVVDGVRSNMVTLSGGGAGGVRIANLADGVNASDAVNLGQLQSYSSHTLSAADAYTDQKVGNLAALTAKQIRQARADAAGGTALALAATGVRFDDRPGKISIGGSAAYYHDQMGIAFGIGSTSEDGRYRFNASVSASPTMTTPDVGAVVGASVSLN